MCVRCSNLNVERAWCEVIVVLLAGKGGGRVAGTTCAHSLVPCEVESGEGETEALSTHKKGSSQLIIGDPFLNPRPAVCLLYHRRLHRNEQARFELRPLAATAYAGLYGAGTGVGRTLGWVGVLQQTIGGPTVETACSSK